MKRFIAVLNPPTSELESLINAFESSRQNRVSIVEVHSQAALLDRLASGLPCDLVILDYLLGDGSIPGEALLERIREVDRDKPVVAVAETGDEESAEKAIRAGATDFLVRGGNLKKRVSTLWAKVSNLLDLIDENRMLGEQNQLLRQAHRSKYRILGESPQILAAIDRIERIAAIPRPVLITGERGTGKELVARAIHEAGGRAGDLRPFVAVSCAGFTDTLLENELFGHERGAFTGAGAIAPGKLEQAENGTLFLDEIGNMSLSFQKKILRVVEYGTFSRLGGKREIRVNTRLIAATNADLKSKMERKELLRDLYDRLAFEVIDVPPLRDREGDIEILARHFLGEFMAEIPTLGGAASGRDRPQSAQTIQLPGECAGAEEYHRAGGVPGHHL